MLEMLITIIVSVLLVILGAGFLGSMICNTYGIEFDGTAWFISVLVAVVLVGIPLWLIFRQIWKK